MTVEKPATGRRPGRPKGIRGADTRSSIVEVARECFQTLGFEETSLTTVAKRSGLTRTAIYNYFESKEVLARAVLLETTGKRDSTLIGRRWWRDPIPDGLSTAQKVRFLLGQSAEAAHLTHHEADFYIRLIKASADDPELHDALREYVGDQRQVFRTVLEEGVRAGDVRADIDISKTLDAISGAVWAFAIGGLAAPNETVRQQVILGLDLLLRPALAE